MKYHPNINLPRSLILLYYRADFKLSHLRPYEPWRCIARIVGRPEYTIMRWEIRKPSIVRGVVQDQRWSIHTVDSAEWWTLKKTAIVMSTVEIMETMETSAASVWFSNAPFINFASADNNSQSHPPVSASPATNVPTKATMNMRQT